MRGRLKWIVIKFKNGYRYRINLEQVWIR